MNNKVKLYRVAHMSSIFNGIYKILNTYNRMKSAGKFLNDSDLTYKIDRLVTHIRLNEPFAKPEYRKFKNILFGDSYKLQNGAVPARSIYSQSRPGMFEDPMIRAEIIKNPNRWNWTSRGHCFHAEHDFVFAFDSQRQMSIWFDSIQEWQLIHDIGFRIYEFHADRQHVVYGHKQVLVFTKDEFNSIRIGSYDFNRALSTFCV